MFSHFLKLHQDIKVVTLGFYINIIVTLETSSLPLHLEYVLHQGDSWLELGHPSF